ncbi:hypothetical protein NEOLEDRAFT_1175778 [Neolentinus lepideus HHB14362 ss-1]|uniref:IATP ATPase inhibitor n=1 Tax=Neolentinus lepideus HHB14362 ss-1 TaxID=1314782 RepID=A0A165UNS6_9AGAM|nr:hypothetical protein NEOLEDRAFT_1175778 [Neolentinus lepideus HHB14362 ss-1]
MSTAQDGAWKSKEQGEEARYINEKERSQLEAIRSELQQSQESGKAKQEHDFEGGFGGQEDLEDRYATTSGEH